MPLGLLGAGIGAIGEIGKIFSGIHQNHLANQINPQYTPYETSPYAQKQLGLAQQLYSGRMFGAGDLEKNILSGQASTLNNINRNATDSSQALALGQLSQGQTNQAFNQLQTQEAQNKYNLLGNLNTAYGAMTHEADKVYEDKLQKYQMDVAEKNALRGAGLNNIFSGIGNLATGAVQGDQLGWFGGGNGNQHTSQFANQDLSTVPVGNDMTQVNPFINQNAMTRTSPSYNVNLNPYGFIGPRQP